MDDVTGIRNTNYKKQRGNIARIGYPLDSHVTYEADGTPVYDRAITSAPLRKLIKSLFSDGVLPNPSINLQVSAGNGMNVLVQPGFALCNGCLKLEETQRTLAVQASDTTYDRIDTVVMRLNDNDSERICDLYIVPGVPATNPVRPALTRDASIWEIGLADLFIVKNSTEISNQRITDTRYETARCGIISSISEFDTSTLYQQIQSDLSFFKEYEQAEFLTWFENIRNQLAQDVAGNLQLQINELWEVPNVNNLLINSDFRNPVNQRGEVEKSTSGCWLDLWRKDGISTASLKDGYIELSAGAESAEFSLYQYLSVKEILGEKVTFSVKKHDGGMISLTADIPGSFPNKTEIIASKQTDDVVLKIEMSSSKKIRVIIGVPANRTVALEWSKLEVGDRATPYVPRIYDEEFLICQRFYQKRNVRDAMPIRIGSDYLRFTIPILPKMQAAPSVDTADLTGVALYLNGSASNLKWKFSAQNSEEGAVDIVAINYDSNGVRTAHNLNLTGMDFVSLKGEACFEVGI